MADNTIDENPGNLKNIPQEDASEANKTNTKTDIKNTNQENQNMEVHHHAHHEGKKNWKSYFWEFSMLFLAVFCGFLAEYQLEHKIEGDREIQYIRSMIEDAKTDTANIHKAIALNMKRVYRLDSLSNKCFNYTQQNNDDPEIYRLFFINLRHPDFVSPIERTMSQLKNAGGMRLIHKPVAADSILLYDDFAKKIINQQAWYENMLKSFVESGISIFNYKHYPSFDFVTLKRNKPNYEFAKIMVKDKAQVIQIGNRASMYRNVVFFYINQLKDGEMHAVNLIHTLRKEYHLENNEE
jgi:hypothetical protein